MSHFTGPEGDTAESNTSVLKQLLDTLRVRGGAIEMIEGDTGKRHSFAITLQQSQCIAAGLQSAGVTAGDYVAFCCNKSILAYSLLLGGLFTGATIVNVPTVHAETMHELTRGHAVKALFYDEQHHDSVTKSVSHMTCSPSVMATIDQKDPTIASLMASKDKFSLYQVQDIKNHVPIIFFSSGTTGLPKGIQVTDALLGVLPLSAAPLPQYCMLTTPFSWMSAVIFFIDSILRKHHFVISNSVDTKHVLQLVEKYEIDTWFVSTGYLSCYINEPTLGQYDLSSVRTVFTGGDTTLRKLAESFSSTVLGGRTRLIALYGTTEVGIIAVGKTEGPPEEGHVTSVYLLPGVEAKVVNDDRDLVGVGCLGQVLLKAKSTTTGYWGRLGFNDELFDRDGFYATGDAGYFDEHGRMYVTGRLSDIITYKQFKFPSVELEELLMSHPAVLEAVVVGRPHPTDIHHATAYVVVCPSESMKIKETDIQAFVDEKAAENHKKLRGGVHFLEELPKLSTSKFDRKLLHQGR